MRLDDKLAYVSSFFRCLYGATTVESVIYVLQPAAYVEIAHLAPAISSSSAVQLILPYLRHDDNDVLAPRFGQTRVVQVGRLRPFLIDGLFVLRKFILPAHCFPIH